MRCAPEVTLEARVDSVLCEKSAFMASETISERLKTMLFSLDFCNVDLHGFEIAHPQVGAAFNSLLHFLYAV